MANVSLFELDVLVREVHRRVSSHRIAVQYVDGLETAMSTENSILLPVIRPPISSRELEYHRYRVVHEVGHHLRHDVFTLAKREQPSESLMYIWNLVEDEAQEREQAFKFRGDRMTMSRGRTIHVQDMLKDYAKMAAGGKEPDDNTIRSIAAYTVGLIARRDWHNTDTLVAACQGVFHDSINTLIDTLVDEGWAARMAESMTVQQAYDLAKQLHARLWPEEDQQQQEQQQDGEGQKQEGQQGDGQPQQGQPGEGGNDPAEAEGEGEVQQNAGEKPEENQGDAGEQQQKAQQNAEGDEASSQEPEQQSAGKFTIHYEQLDQSHSHDPEHTKDEASEYRVSYQGWQPSDHYDFMSDEEFRTLSGDYLEQRGAARCRAQYSPARGVANRIRRHVQSQNRAHWETRRKSGKLDKRRIKQIRMGTADRHRRVFKKRHEAEAINTALTVLVDTSGSMSGGRIHMAATGAGLLVDAFDTTLHIPTEVLGHTCGSRVTMGIVKKFDEHLDGSRVYTRLRGMPMVANADGDALMWAARRLRQRRERRKILLVLSDGQPVDSARGCPGDVLAGAIDIIKKGGVEVYGIGIAHDQVKLWYGDNCINIWDESELPNAIIRTAAQFVERK